MADSSEDVLGELYAWDSTIDEMYERGVDHADFDEDEALEAYEEMIQVGAGEDHGDAVLSLAAQLLTKHFYKFPHVHMNVVDVLLALCAPARAQAVRIHTVRSLLQIVKSAPTATPPLVEPCRARIADRVAALIRSEASNVVVRQLTQLQETLASVDTELKKVERREKWKEKKEQAKAAKEDEKARRTASKEEDDRRDKSVTARDAKNAQREEERRRDEERRREEFQREEAAKRERREARFRTAPTETSESNAMSSSETKQRDDRAWESSNDRDEKRRDSYRESTRDNDDRSSRQQERAPEPSRERRPGATKETGNGCPPSSFIFIGGVPRNTYPEDIINYLSCIDESVTHSCVQIKFPNAHPNAAGYSFVSLESVEHARKAIRHIQTTEFNGRTLIGDFARGPPCSTLQFVERNGSLGMHDQNAVLPVNVDTIDREVWDELCDFLKQYGSLDVLRDGRVRFRDTESAKLVIRKHRIFIAGREFLPIYDPEEQSEIDSSRRRRRSGDDGDFRRSDGMSRYGDSSHSDRRGVRDDGDRKRHRSQSFDRDQKEKLSRRDHNDERGERYQRHGPREFDQARYGPRDSPSTFNRQDDMIDSKAISSRRERSPSREREIKADHRDRETDRERRNSTRTNSHRSASRSPIRSLGVEKVPSQRGRSRSRSHDKRPSQKYGRAKAEETRRSRSPAKSISSAKHYRDEVQESGRGRRDSSNAPREGDYVSRESRDRKGTPLSGEFDRRNSFQKSSESARRSRSPDRKSEYPDDRRKQEFTKREYTERVSQPHRGRSQSPRRAPPSELSGNGFHDKRNYGRDESRYDQERARAFSRDDKRPFDKYGSNDHGSGGKVFYGPPRDESRPSGYGDNGRDHHGRRGSGPQQMSKYGTVGGAQRSPSPQRFGREEPSRGRDQSDRFSRGDDKHAQRNEFRSDDKFHRYGNENHSRENRDRRSSPTRHHFNDHGNQQSPVLKHDSGRGDFGDNGRRRPRSLSPFSGHKKRRSHSPRQAEERGRDHGHRTSRFDKDDRRRYDNQGRHFNRDDGGDGRGGRDGNYKGGRARDDRRNYDRENTKQSSPRKHPKRSDETHQQSPSAQAPPDEHMRTPSPTAFNDDMSDARLSKESPRATAKGAASSTYEDIDECMVDYEEDD